MKLICDTNVWYDIAAGRRDPVALKKDNDELVATPTSFLEIASLIDKHNLAERRAAAQAVLNHADSIIEDCETHLVRVLGFSVPGSAVDWKQGFTAVAQAPSTAELSSGVSDFVDRVVRTVNVPLACQWRTYQWSDFEKKVVDAIDAYFPGYKKARQSGKSKQMNKKQREPFIEAMRSDECQEAMLRCGVFGRALLVCQESYREPSVEEAESTKQAFMPYIKAYTEYLIRCATTFAPQPNDLGDSECFLYLQDDRRFLSSDRRWVEIAQATCPAYCLDPEASSD